MSRTGRVVVAAAEEAQPNQANGAAQANWPRSAGQRLPPARRCSARRRRILFALSCAHSATIIVSVRAATPGGPARGRGRVRASTHRDQKALATSQRVQVEPARSAQAGRLLEPAGPVQWPFKLPQAMIARSHLNLQQLASAM